MLMHTPKPTVKPCKLLSLVFAHVAAIIVFSQASSVSLILSCSGVPTFVYLTGTITYSPQYSRQSYIALS